MRGSWEKVRSRTQGARAQLYRPMGARTCYGSVSQHPGGSLASQLKYKEIHHKNFIDVLISDFLPNSFPSD